jgi:hypothetical protein
MKFVHLVFKNPKMRYDILKISPKGYSTKEMFLKNWIV